MIQDHYLKDLKVLYIKNYFIKSFVRGNISDLLYLVHSPLYSPTRNITYNNIEEQMPIKNTINI